MASRPARVLALLALLFVAGLQAAEAGHDHAADESVAQCLLCKVSVDAVVTAAARGLPIGLQAEWELHATTDSPCLGNHSPFQARGPPPHS
jgi:hypothetical protein